MLFSAKKNTRSYSGTGEHPAREGSGQKPTPICRRCADLKQIVSCDRSDMFCMNTAGRKLTPSAKRIDWSLVMTDKCHRVINVSAVTFTLSRDNERCIFCEQENRTSSSNKVPGAIADLYFARLGEIINYDSPLSSR